METCRWQDALTAASHAKLQIISTPPLTPAIVRLRTTTMGLRCAEQNYRRLPLVLWPGVTCCRRLPLVLWPGVTCCGGDACTTRPSVPLYTYL